MTSFFEGEPPHSIEDHRAKTAFIHQSSYVDTPCKIGENTAILHFTHIMGHSIIGDNCHIGHNVTIGSGVIIGNHVSVLNNAMLNSGVVLEDDVYCGPSTIVSSLKRVRGKSQAISAVTPTLVRAGANIGANTTIASGFTIGRHAFVEAGTVIDRNIPDFALVFGNPLRFGGWRCECGESLKFKSETTINCKQCGTAYIRQAEHKIAQHAVHREGHRNIERAPVLDPHSELDPSIRFLKRQDR